MINDSKALKEWAINNVKNKDIIHKKLKYIKEEGSDFFAEYEDKSCYFIIKPYIKELTDLKNKDFVSLVLFNTKENLDFVIKRWDALVKYDKLSIYFVNLKDNEKWILHPSTHNRVCSNKKLKNGLRTLFSSVAEYKGSTGKT